MAKEKRTRSSEQSDNNNVELESQKFADEKEAEVVRSFDAESGKIDVFAERLVEMFVESEEFKQEAALGRDLKGAEKNKLKQEVRDMIKKQFSDPQSNSLSSVMQLVLNDESDLFKAKDGVAKFAKDQSIEDLMKRLSDSTNTLKAAKELASPIAKIFGFFKDKNGKMLSALKSAEKLFGVKLNNETLANLSPGKFELIRELAGQRWSLPELLTLTPFIVDLITMPESQLAFTVDMTKVNVVLVDGLKQQYFKSHSDTDKTFVSTSDDLPSGSLEMHLVKFAVASESTFNKIFNSLEGAMHTRLKEPNAKEAYGVTPTKLLAIKKNIIDLSSSLKQKDAELEQTQKKVATEQEKLEERNANALAKQYDTKQVLARLAKKFEDDKADRESRRINGEKISEEELELIDMSINFCKNVHSLKDFIENFYNPQFKRNQDKVYIKDNNIDEEEQNRIAAQKTRDDIQRIIKFIVMDSYSKIIESGGEPTEEFNTAVRKGVGSYAYSPDQVIANISRALTGLKLAAGTVGNDATYLNKAFFAAGTRDQKKYYSQELGREIVITKGKVAYKVNSGKQGISDFATEFEKGLDAFESSIRTSYNARLLTNLGDPEIIKKMSQVAMQSDYIDLVNQMPDGHLVTQVVPTIKQLMVNFFAKRGWRNGMELEADIGKYKSGFYSITSEFLEKYYPEMGNAKRSEIAQLAIGLAYQHLFFQKQFSRTRMQSGFDGKYFHRNGAIFNNYYANWMFSGNIESMVKHKNWAKGALMTSEKRDPTNKIDALGWEVPVGAMLTYGSNDFGRFLINTDDYFKDGGPRALMRDNIFVTGTDEEQGGWRQRSKAIGNLSTKLYVHDKNTTGVTLNSKYKEVDHYTNVWKSIENVGINYTKAFTDLIKISVDKNGSIKDEPKAEHFVKFLYRRYLAQDNTEHADSGVNKFRASQLQDLCGGALSEEQFWQYIKSGIKKKGDTIAELYATSFNVMEAERNPLMFLNYVTPHTEQTGVTLRKEILDKYLNQKNSDFFDASWNSNSDQDLQKFTDRFEETVMDLTFVQSEGRKRATEMINTKRTEWEKGKFENNIFGADLRGDFSDVELVAGIKGYRLTTQTVAGILKQTLEKNGVPAIEVDRRVRCAVRLFDDTLSGMTETPDLPEYEYLVKKIGEYAPEAWADYAKSGEVGIDSDDKDALKAYGQSRGQEYIRKNIGSTEAEYKKKYAKTLVSRIKWLNKLDKDGFLGARFEADFDESFTIYSNADQDHLKRMYGTIQDTTVATKDTISNGDGEQSLTEVIKDFTKDPMGSADKLSAYLNKYSKTLENEIDKPFVNYYRNFYVNSILDAIAKEDKYRPQHVLDFGSVFNNVVESYLGFNKMSLAMERNNFMVGRNLGALEMNKLLRYMVQKKLLPPEHAKDAARRLKATVPDIIKEIFPYLAIFLMVQGIYQIYIKGIEEVADGKKK